MKKWRGMAIRRYDCFAFVSHAHYLIIGSNFCQALVANPTPRPRRIQAKENHGNGIGN
jgi:hypothetical protein